MATGAHVVQIYCDASSPLAGSLAAVVSTVKDCVARVDSIWPTDDQSGQWDDVFLVISHLDFPDATEWEKQLNLARSIKRSRRFPEFIFISSNLSLAQQKDLLEAHVTEILESPINLQRLRYLIESRKIEHAHWLKQHQTVADPCLSSKSRLMGKIKKIANVETNILLTGETGVGKTYMAEKIHNASKRAKHPFVVVDCASIPPSLVESELFGHAKGAFTDACSKKIGQFEHAGAGTILLDEIDSLPPAVQAKLLRVVENRKFRRVGENVPIAMNARIISATNMDLDDLVEQKQFRADLFFRLNAYEIRIPNLCKRREEIEPLCQFFAEEFARENDQDIKTFANEVTDLFGRYDWPGNLRELRNCVFHGAIDTEDSVIRLENLPEKLIQFSESIDDSSHGFSIVPYASKTREDSEHFDSNLYREAKRLILALEHNHYNRSLTAKELGVSRMTVYNMMKRHRFG